ELFSKLKNKGFNDADIRPVLKDLEEKKFLDDQKFAEIFVDNLKRYKDFGYFGIKAKLMARQIPSDIVEAALSEYYTKEDEERVAKRLVDKLKFRGKSEWEKLARALENRGFRSEAIRKVLK
ncbi:MAG: regulatory protein RecX, partial [Parcubacteria group bacterium]